CELGGGGGARPAGEAAAALRRRRGAGDYRGAREPGQARRQDLRACRAGSADDGRAAPPDRRRAGARARAPGGARRARGVRRRVAGDTDQLRPVEAAPARLGRRRRAARDRGLRPAPAAARAVPRPVDGAVPQVRTVYRRGRGGLRPRRPGCAWPLGPPSNSDQGPAYADPGLRILPLEEEGTGTALPNSSPSMGVKGAAGVAAATPPPRPAPPPAAAGGAVRPAGSPLRCR